MAKKDRNYTVITDDERRIWNDLQEKEVVYHNGQPTRIRLSLYSEYPKAVRHYISLFPNNFLDAVDLHANQDDLKLLLNEFQTTLSEPSTTEQDILNFIKAKNAYFIIASILKTNYRFGHHALFVFPELQLTVNHKVDFLLVGENSDGHHFVFVECENPKGSIINKDGSYGKTIRKGVKQIDDWEIWLEKNYAHLKPVFEKNKNPALQLPDEFFEFDKTRMHYVIVAGRRDDFKSLTYRNNRKLLEERKLSIIHYDNLLEEANEVATTERF